MTIRAAIFDIYNTILTIGQAPADAATQWQQLYQEAFQREVEVTLPELNARCVEIVRRHHAAAHAIGIRWPEVQWPTVMIAALPELGLLSAAKRDDFIRRHILLERTLQLADGAADVLRALKEKGVTLGIASNAQAYTLRELDDLLSKAGLNTSLFDSSLCVWSFEHGFSKPDSHVFRVLTARLEARGVAPGEILMVGDRTDNDIEPAKMFGWQTWQIPVEGKAPGAAPSGTWRELSQWLRRV